MYERFCPCRRPYGFAADNKRLAVFLNKERSAVEVVNDKNDEIAAFYRYVQHHCDSLLAEIDGYLHSRETFNKFLNNPGHTELQKVARWYILKVTSFSGFGQAYGRDKDSFRGVSRDRHYPLIKELKDRLAAAYIENKDWEDVVKFFDKEGSFTYFDPPYVTGDSGTYEPFTPFDMQRLRNRLDVMKGKWLLSCDNSPDCRDIFCGLKQVVIPIKYSAGAMSVDREEKSELLVMSDDIIIPHGYDKILKK